MDATPPIASAEQFKKALLSLRDQHKFRNTHFVEMLRFHCQAPGHQTTASQLAQGMQPPLASYAAASLQYNKLAHLIADELNFTPPQRKKGTRMWWQALSLAENGGDDTLDGNFQLTMRPELVSALLELKWSK